MAERKVDTDQIGLGDYLNRLFERLTLECLIRKYSLSIKCRAKWCRRRKISVYSDDLYMKFRNLYIVYHTTLYKACKVHHRPNGTFVNLETGEEYE